MILKANPKNASPQPKKRLAFVGVLLALCLAFGLGWMIDSASQYRPVSEAVENRENLCLSVAEAAENRENLIGTRVCVRGKAEMQVAVTLVACEPQRCDCNDSWGEITFYDEEERGILVKQVNEENGKYWYWYKTTYLLLDQLSCEGNECFLFCSPFCPVNGMIYELTGTLAPQGDSGIILTDLDLDTIRQYNNGVASPVSTGPCQINLSQWP